MYALSNSYVPYNEFEGTYAEYALFKEEWVAPAPSADVLSLTHAAGVPLVALTAVQVRPAHRSAHRTARLTLRFPLPFQALDKADKAIGGLKGKRILVLGASGGVGQFAVQLAKAEHGMHVTAVCSAKQSDFVKSLGADETWDYKLGIDNLKATYSAAEKQFDVVLDVIGEELLAAAMSGGILKSGGVVTHIMNRGSKGADKEYTAASEAGTGPKFVTTLVEPSGDQLSRLTQLFNEKKLRLKVAQQMPLEEVGKAQELVIEGHAGGKVVLTI